MQSKWYVRIDDALANRWVFRITADGKIELNPEIPQDEAVKKFIELCHQQQFNNVRNVARNFVRLSLSRQANEVINEFIEYYESKL